MGRTYALRLVINLGIAVLLTACFSDTASEPQDRVPVITVTGIQDGAAVDQAVTITISVDVGAFSAFLNGAPFISGTTVDASGDYILDVGARNGSATANLSLAFSIQIAPEAQLIIRIFDLGDNEAGGGGDAILFTDSSGAGVEHVLVDAGPSGAGASDPGFVLRQLQNLNVNTLEVMVLSHAHSDHFWGMNAVLQGLTVRQFFYNGQIRNLSFYNDVLSDAQSFADEVTVPSTVTEIQIGASQVTTTLSVIPGLATYLANSNADGSQINEGSLGTTVERGPFRMFLTGDGEVEANARWRTQFSTMTSGLDILKVGHHGGNDAVFDNGFSGNSAWMSHTVPEIAVLSANGVTHPRQNATSLLLGLPATQTYCTNVHGTIEIRVVDDGTFSVAVERNAGAVCVPGTDADT